MEIIESITLEDVCNSKPQMIYYAAKTCWWTHAAKHLSKMPPPTEEEVKRAATLLRQASRTPDAPIVQFMDRARHSIYRLPCDPRGSVLFETDDVEGFLKSAVENYSHYGKHGLRAFMAAHHLNCVLDLTTQRPWSGVSWDEYNEALDRLDERKRK